jgi:hypothetical protein
MSTDGQTDKAVSRDTMQDTKTNKTRRMNKVEQKIKLRKRDGNRKKEMITDIAFVLASRER